MPGAGKRVVPTEEHAAKIAFNELVELEARYADEARFVAAGDAGA
jgi:hypothetical protein